MSDKMYNGFSPNKNYWKDKTLDKFLKEEAHNGLTEKQLRDVWKDMFSSDKPKSNTEPAKQN